MERSYTADVIVKGHKSTCLLGGSLGETLLTDNSHTREGNEPILTFRLPNRPLLDTARFSFWGRVLPGALAIPCFGQNRSIHHLSVSSLLICILGYSLLLCTPGSSHFQRQWRTNTDQRISTNPRYL